MKSLAFAVSLAIVVALAPHAAQAGCPQAMRGGCDAVTQLSATFEGAPACVRIKQIEPENGCVCQGSVDVANDCDFNIAAVDFTWNGGTNQVTLFPGKTGSFDVVGSPETSRVSGSLGENHRELNITANEQPFKLILDFTVEHRQTEIGCNALGKGRLGLFSVGLVLGALLLARRRVKTDKRDARTPDIS